MARYSNISTDGQGKYRRLRVDVGQTGFFAGREFRMFAEFGLGNNVAAYYKINATAVQAIVNYIGTSCWTGSLRVELLAEGGTEGGTFSTTIIPRRTNRMTTADLTYTGQVTVSTGGTYTGGVLAEAHQLDSSTGSGSHSELAEDSRPYGLPVGNYYIKIQAGSGGCTGDIVVRYEERPAGV